MGPWGAAWGTECGAADPWAGASSPRTSVRFLLQLLDSLGQLSG